MPFKVAHKGVIDLIRCARDAGANGGTNAAGLSPKRTHGGNGLISYAAKRALPARMCGTNYARCHIGKEHGRTICCQNAQQKPRAIGHQRIGGGAVFERHGLIDCHDIGTMDLEHSGQICTGQHGLGGASPVFCNSGRIIF